MGSQRLRDWTTTIPPEGWQISYNQNHWAESSNPMQERSLHNQEGWKEKKKSGWTCTPGRELWKMQGSLTLKPLSPDWKGASEAERRALQLDCSRQNGQTPAQRVLATFYTPQLESIAASVHGSWMLKLRLQWTDPGKDWGWLYGDRLKGLERGPSCNWGM